MTYAVVVGSDKKMS